MLLTDDAVRNELMEQLPVILHLCHPISQLNSVSTLLPVIVRYLTDTSSQVHFYYMLYLMSYNYCADAHYVDLTRMFNKCRRND